ncbi:proton-conducting transporter transmembrane domain-containing protein [Raineya sp.]|jgi:NADH:ubiquinone oxidoreductase subunit 5 (subunit L)/multisubunit Na+/H+ antiporter MnhA subunit
MNYEYFLLVFCLIPLTAFGITFLWKESDEYNISRTTLYTVTLNLILVLVFIIFWIFQGFTTYNIKEFVLYESDIYVFLIDFYFDKITAVYLFVGAIISFLIVRYSGYYMHLERGFRRFFSTISFFVFAYNFTVLSGNLETLYVGWEMLGIASFLLIAFYRDRYLPVKNAVKVFSIYRIGDVFFLLAMWASHHLGFKNIDFAILANNDKLQEHLLSNYGVTLFIGICFGIVASVKSAQFPFVSWVARAMEGPTPSSAIFYGSLSLHLGVFLLMRTMPFWQEATFLQVILILIGAITALISYFTASVQPTIKTQIAYASTAQIGLIFIEIALGFENIALLHFVGNAFLRTYQLLVSPSVVAYLMREQLYHFKPHRVLKGKWSKKMKYSLYVLSLQEFRLDKLISYLFVPFRQVGAKLHFLTYYNIFYYFIPFYVVGWGIYIFERFFPEWIRNLLPILFAVIALLMVMKAFSEKIYPRLSWLLVFLGHLWIALAVSLNEKFSLNEVFLYLSGVFITGLAGWIALEWLKKQEPQNFSLAKNYGHSHEYPRLGQFFFIMALGLMGLPLTPTFIGEKLIIGHVHRNQYLLAFLISSFFVIEGIALIRLYAKLFLGVHCKSYHETPVLTS